MKKTASRTRWTAWILGLGAVSGGTLLWACSSSSNQAAVLSGTYPEDSSVGVVPEASASEGGETRDAGHDADARADAQPDATAPACPLVDAGCVTAANCGAQVNVIEVASGAPTATGGTIAEGTYVMTAYSLYTGSGGATGAPGDWFIETQYLTLVGGDTDAGAEEAGDDAGDAGSTPASQFFQLVKVTQSDGGAATTLEGNVLFQFPTQATFTFNCPATAPLESAEYTATATTLQIFMSVSVPPAATGTAVITYTKQ